MRHQSCLPYRTMATQSPHSAWRLATIAILQHQRQNGDSLETAEWTLQTGYLFEHVVLGNSDIFHVN